MKKVSPEKITLLLGIGLFSFICLGRAFICALFVANSPSNLSLDSKYAADYHANWFSVLISVVVLTVFGFIALISIYGIIKDRNWAVKVWLGTTAPLVAYFLMALYLDPSNWLDHIFGLGLCAYSWFILWYVPRKQSKAIS
jgi:hypothetical protein